MVTDQHVEIPIKSIKLEKAQALAAAKADMDVKMARKCVKDGLLPGEMRKVHDFPSNILWNLSRQLWSRIAYQA